MIERHLLLCATLIAVTGCLPGPSLGATVRAIKVFHRSGQTFITWAGIQPEKNTTYNVYQSDKPVTSGSLSSARKLAERIPSGSGTDVISTRPSKSIKVVSIKDPYGSDWWYENTIDPPKEGQTPPGYIIHRLGKPIEAGTELWVHTAQKPCRSFYAVTAVDASGTEDRQVIPGENATCTPVVESVTPPKPIMEGSLRSGGAVVRSYIHWSNADICNRDGVPMKFQLATGPKVKPSTPSPLLIILHGAGAPERLPIPTPENFIVVVPDNFAPGFPAIYDWWYGYNTNSYSHGDLSKGINTNYTERRLLYIIDWAKHEFNVDANRVYLAGASMGGTGTLSFGLRHPEIFAAVFANVPNTNTGLGISANEPWFESYLGKRSDAVKTQEGISIWDRLNMTDYVSNPSRELPFVKTLSSRDDPAMPWQQIPPFVQAMNRSRHGFLSGWGIGGHNMPFDTRPMTLRRFDLFRIARNESFPAFSNSSLNDDPGTGDAGVGTPTGQMGGGFAWDILADTPERWQIEVRVAADAMTNPTTDITPRRLQQFRIVKGKRYRYTITDLAGNARKSGSVTADRWGLLTLTSVNITRDGVRVQVE